MESIGPQPEIILQNVPVPFSDGVVLGDPFKLHYDKSWTFGPAPYPAATPVEAGVYKLMAVLTCTTPSNTPGPFAGFDEGPLLQFYTAP